MHGVDPSYVDWLRRIVCTPRTPIEQLREIELPANFELISLDRLARCDGSSEAPLMISVNHKVLRFAGSSCPAFERIREDFGGREITYLLSLMAYEPHFELPSAPERMTLLHRRVVEDSIARKTACIASFDWICVGLLDSLSSAAVLSTECHKIENESENDCNSDGLRPVRKRRSSLCSSIKRNLERFLESSPDLDSPFLSPSLSPYSASLSLSSVDRRSPDSQMMPVLDLSMEERKTSSSSLETEKEEPVDACMTIFID